MNAARRRCHVFASLALLSGLAACGLTSSGSEAPSSPKTLALVGGHILTQTDAGSFVGTIVVRDGKIVAVGKDVAIPTDAERIDITGYMVTPGLIDAHSTLWLNPAAARESAADGGLDVIDGIDPHDEDWKEVARQGVTAVYVQPAGTGVLGGQGAVLRVGPAETVEELVIKAGAAAQAALGTQPAAPVAAATPQFAGRRGGGGGRRQAPVDTPQAPVPTGNALTRFAQYEQLKRSFDALKQPDAGPARARRDATKDFLRKVLKGEVPLRLEAHRDDDIRNALRLADELKLRVVLEGVSNPTIATEMLVSRRVPLVLGPFIELEDIPANRQDRPADWPKGIVTADTPWALGTFSSQPRGSRLLRAQAAAAVASGLDPDQVLRAMTRSAAEILGVGDRLGTIAVGKQADLAVFAGSPLDPSTPVALVLSSGKITYQAKPKPIAPDHSALRTQHAALTLPERLPKRYALKSKHMVREDGKFQAGIVVVEDGKVTALGPTANVPDGVPTYDLGIAVLSPGLMAAHSSLGLAGAIDDPAEADAGQIRATDVYDPQSRGVRELLEGGFTSALFAPGSVNVIGGGVAAVRLGAAEPALSEAGVKFVLSASARSAGRAPDTDDDLPPALQGRGGRGPNRYPGSLAGQVELIDQVLSGKAPASDLYVPVRVRDQIQAERRRQIAAVLERKQVAFFEAHTRAEIDAALRLIAKHKLRAVLMGPEEIKPFAEEIKKLGVGIVARPPHTGDYDKTAAEQAAATTAGLPVSFGTGSPQDLRLTAALAMNAGMPRDAAWRGLTTAAGRITGLNEGAGRLTVGAPADLVVWDGSPLDLCSRPLRVIVDGKLVHSAP